MPIKHKKQFANNCPELPCYLYNRALISLEKKKAAVFIPESNARQGQKTPLPFQSKLKLFSLRIYFFLLHRTDDSSVILNT